MSNLTTVSTTASSIAEATYPLRVLFYLVTPAETTFDKLENVPDIVTMAFPYFLFFLAIELIVATYKGRDIFLVNDLLTSVGAGLLSRLPDLFGRSVSTACYIWVHENYLVYKLPSDSPWTWLLALLYIDFAYYWFHRASHELNFLWAFHQTHHSSEYMNLGTALRQAAIQPYGSFIFYLPLAPFVAPPIAVMHFQLNLLYQFWIHTEFIGKLGPLEWILNTASHHRVHHGRNPYAIDKNYAGFLIIWDRIFGTFEAEREDEKVVYGLIHNIKTFNAFKVQFDHWKQLYKKVRMVWRSKKFHGWTRFVNLLKAIFYGPGWFPSKAQFRLGDRNDLPKVEEHVVRYGTRMPLWLSAYCIVHFLTAVFFFVYTVETVETKGFYDIRTSGVAIACLISFASWSFIYDRHNLSRHVESLRCILFALFFVPLFADAFRFDGKIASVAQYFYFASLGINLIDLAMEKTGINTIPSTNAKND